MIVKGIEFMFIGMTVVFIFLALLVALVHLSHAALRLFGRRYVEEEKKIIPPSITRIMGKHDDIAVAIAAARSFAKR